MACGLSVPTQTAVLTFGVKPTIQASELPPVSRYCWVPVLAADSRPLASGSSEADATGFIEYVTSLATLESITCLAGSSWE